MPGGEHDLCLAAQLPCCCPAVHSYAACGMLRPCSVCYLLPGRFLNVPAGMFITAMAANPLAVNLATEALGQTISWGALAARECGSRYALFTQPPAAALCVSSGASCVLLPTPTRMPVAPPCRNPSSTRAPYLAGTWAMAGLVPGAVCLLLTPALLYILYPPEVKDTPDAPAKVHFGTVGRLGGGCCAQSAAHGAQRVLCCTLPRPSLLTAAARSTARLDSGF